MIDNDSFGLNREKSDNDLLNELIKRFNAIINVVDAKPHIQSMRLAFSVVENIYMNFSYKIKMDDHAVEAKISLLRDDFQKLLTNPTKDMNDWKFLFEMINRIKDAFRILREKLK